MSLVIAKQIDSVLPTTTGLHLASSWRFSYPTDLSKDFRFTDWPRAVVLSDGLEYTPLDGLEVSARRREADLGAQSRDTRGIISSTAITEEDIRARRLDGAIVTETLFDARYPWKEPFETVVYYIRDVQYDKDEWRAEVSGIQEWLDEPTGELWGPDCRVDVFSQGVGKCNLDPATHRFVNSLVEGAGVITQRQKFTANVTASPPWGVDGFGTDGTLIWKTGQNKGLTFDIKKHEWTTGVIHTFTLQLPTPFDIEDLSGIQDTFDILPGCNHQPGILSALGDCKNKFLVDNLINFQGEPYIPGNDKTIGSSPN